MITQSSNFGLSAADMQAIQMALFQSECSLTTEPQVAPQNSIGTPTHKHTIRVIEDRLGSIA